MPNLNNLLELLQNRNNGIETVNIGGKQILVKKDKTTRISDALGNLANTGVQGLAFYQQQQQLPKFKQELANIIQTEQDPQKQIQGIMQIGTKYGGFMGMDDQVKNYINSLTKMSTQSASSSNIPVPEGISSSDQVKATALARKIAGVRGINRILPSIYDEMGKGKTIDQIEDELRYAGQSPEFSGNIRNAAQSILINAPQQRAQNAMDYIDDQLANNNIDGVKTTLKRLARSNAGVEEGRNINGKERTVKLLDEIQEDLSRIEASGVPTNIFTGTIEQIFKKVGTVREPGLRKIATKIATAIQNYRRSMSGVAFSVPESAEYRDMFPSISRTANFNSANIQALKDVMQGDLTNFYTLSMGEEPYNSLFGNETGTQPIPNAPNPKEQNRVTVVSPSGQRGSIPISQLQEALAQGYKRAR